MTNCLFCGRPFTGGEWAEKKPHTFNLGDGIAAGVTLERRSPARSATFQADVAVPLAQSLVTGLFLGSAAWAVVDVATGLAFGLGCAALCWLILTDQHRRLLWNIETWTGADLDGDGETGKPQTTRIEISETDGKRRRLINLDTNIPLEKQIKFAKGVQRGKPLSEREWTGTGRLFTDAEFEELRDALMARGYAKWRNPRHRKQGWILTGRGEKVMQRLAQEDRTQ